MGLDAGGGWTDYDHGSYVTDVDVDQQLGGTGLPFSSFVTFGTPSIDHGSDASLIGGGQLGYNYQWGHIVFGVEGDFNGVGSRKTGRFQPETIFSTSNFGFDTETNLLTMREALVNWVGSARGRVGWAQGSALLYLTGGVAFADTSLRSHDAASTTYFDQNNGLFIFNVTDTASAQDEQLVTGWTGGAGAEWAVTKIVSMALEYRHNGFGDETYNFSRKGRNGPIFPGATRLGLEEDQVTLRVNFLLGHMGPGH